MFHPQCLSIMTFPKCFTLQRTKISIIWGLGTLTRWILLLWQTTKNLKVHYLSQRTSTARSSEWKMMRSSQREIAASVPRIDLAMETWAASRTKVLMSFYPVSKQLTLCSSAYWWRLSGSFFMHTLPSCNTWFLLVPAITHTVLSASMSQVLLSNLTHMVAYFPYQAFVSDQLVNSSLIGLR